MIRALWHTRSLSSFWAWGSSAGGAATCVCEEPFRPEGLRCVEEPGQSFRSTCQIGNIRVLACLAMDRPSVFKNAAWEQSYQQAYDAVLAAWPCEVDSHLVETSFGGTHMLSAGSPENQPMVLLPGAGLSATMWRPSFQALSGVWRVHAVDTLWDMGKGQPRAFPASHKEATRWLTELLDSLGYEQVDLVGLSYGGFLSFRFAMDVPQRIRRLAVLSPAMSLTNLSVWFVLNALGNIIVPTRPRAICRALTRWVAETPVPPDLMEQWVAGIRGIRFPTPLHKVPPQLFSDDELRSLELPTLLVMGEKEWACKNPKGAMERFQKLVPHGRAEMLAGAGHVVNMDQPERVHQLLLDHFG